MKFAIVRLLLNAADPETGRRRSASEVLGEAIREASFFEELGFDAYGIGEHHINDAEASSPPVLLGYLAASTKRIRLFTGVTVLPLLDPVRVAEDYATLDVISGGRVEVVIGKGNTEEQSKVFGYTNADQWDRNRENYELLRRLLREERVTWSGTYRPPLDAFTSRPRPLTRFRIWHGSATSTVSTELAAKWGDPLFSANVSGPLLQYQALVDDYRRRWAEYGRDPADALVAAGAAALHVHRDSQTAVEEFRPSFERLQANARLLGAPKVYDSLEDAIARGSYFVGSPQQVIEQFHRYHEALGHEVQHVGDLGTEGEPVRRRSIELFAAEVAPELRRSIPDRLWDTPLAADGPQEPEPIRVTAPASADRAAEPVFASAADVKLYGEYSIRREPGDTRPLYRFQGRTSFDGASGFAVESGRYHLYAGWFCPWAQRTTIALELAGLRDVVSVSYVDDTRDARGWAFRATHGPDPVNGFRLLRDAYEATEPGFDGHVSVPTLWDRVRGVVVSNEFRTIGIDFATQFGALATPLTETYPADRADDIEALDRWLGPAVNQGVQAATANDAAGLEARRVLNEAFVALDERLAGSRYLLGDQVTEADIRLFVTLVRFDSGANAQRTINGGLDTFPNLWAYARDLYSIEAFRVTTKFSSFPHPEAQLAGWDVVPERAFAPVG